MRYPITHNLLSVITKTALGPYQLIFKYIKNINIYYQYYVKLLLTNRRGIFFYSRAHAYKGLIKTKPVVLLACLEFHDGFHDTLQSKFPSVVVASDSNRMLCLLIELQGEHLHTRPSAVMRSTFLNNLHKTPYFSQLLQTSFNWKDFRFFIRIPRAADIIFF